MGDFAKDPLKGGFVAKLASIPLASAAGLEIAEAAPAATTAGETAIGSATTLMERGVIRLQATALNNPIGSYIAGFSMGYLGLPIPQGFGAVKLGAQHGQAANATVKVIKVLMSTP